MTEPIVSIIIPARNEAALIAGTLEAALRAAGHAAGRPEAVPHLAGTGVEIIVVDNASDDHTALIVQRFVERHGVRLAHWPQRKAPCARNHGARLARGRLLIFVDADTHIPMETVARVQHWLDGEGHLAGIGRLASLEPGLRAWAWWTFWGLMRELPLARAKAMPALMFCTRAAFHAFGPFDESVVIGEEWPILAGVYRAHPRRFIYDRALTARSSSRRMALQPFGYVRTFAKYVWAVLHRSGRLAFTDRVRHDAAQEPLN